VQTDIQQSCDREARREALRAEDHPFDVVAGGFGQASVAGRVATPFQDVAFDHQGTRDLPLVFSLCLRPDVDEYRSPPQSVGHLRGGKAAIAAPGGREDEIDAAHSGPFR